MKKFTITEEERQTLIYDAYLRGLNMGLFLFVFFTVILSVFVLVHR
jgi:hypothetical protein